MHSRPGTVSQKKIQPWPMMLQNGSLHLLVGGAAKLLNEAKAARHAAMVSFLMLNSWKNFFIMETVPFYFFESHF